MWNEIGYEVKIMITFCCKRDTMSCYLAIFLLLHLEKIVGIRSKSVESCFSLRGIKVPLPYAAKGWTKEIPMFRSFSQTTISFLFHCFVSLFLLFHSAIGFVSVNRVSSIFPLVRGRFPSPPLLQHWCEVFCKWRAEGWRLFAFGGHRRVRER